MNEMIERATAALRSFECVAERQYWRILDVRESSASAKVVFTGKDWAEAQAECDRLNTRAVLVAIREPTNGMVEAGQNAMPFGGPMAQGWRAMIDEVLDPILADASAASSR